MAGRVVGHHKVGSGWLGGCRSSLESAHGVERRICRNFGKFASISNFACTVGHMNGVESAQGPNWSETTPGAVPGVMGTIPRES